MGMNVVIEKGIDIPSGQENLKARKHKSTESIKTRISVELYSPYSKNQNMFKKIKQNKFGVTLIELMVAVSLFSVIILSATQIFKMVIEGQRNAIAAQNVQENMRYAFETMSKEIRMATISNHDCESIFTPEAEATNKVFNTTTNAEGDILYFKNKDGICTAYYLLNGSIMIIRGVNTAAISPNEIKISNLEFRVADDLIGAFHSIQPIVTMKMDIEVIGKEMHKQEMKMQTTISSRYYE